jgi:hypothetical protein
MRKATQNSGFQFRESLLFFCNVIPFLRTNYPKAFLHSLGAKSSSACHKKINNDEWYKYSEQSCNIIGSEEHAASNLKCIIGKNRWLQDILLKKASAGVLKFSIIVERASCSVGECSASPRTIANGKRGSVHDAPMCQKDPHSTVFSREEEAEWK